MAIRDTAGAVPARLDPTDRRAAGRHLRGKPHLQAARNGPVPDLDRGAGGRAALLQGLPGRPARRRVVAVSGDEREAVRQPGERSGC